MVGVGFVRLQAALVSKDAITYRVFARARPATVSSAPLVAMLRKASYCSGSEGSAIVVYDEKGNLVETITGFKFALGEPAPAINPSKRMGWAFGPGFNQLQQFFY